MHKRYLIAQAYLYTLLFAILAMGGIILLDALQGRGLAPRALGSSVSTSAAELLGLLLLLGMLLSVVVLSQRPPEACSLRLDRRTLLAGLCGVLLSTGGWYLLCLQNSRNLASQSDLLLSSLQNSIHDVVETRLALIRRMTERWETLGALPSQRFWQQEAGSYLRDLPSFSLIAVLDQEKHISYSQAHSPADMEWLEHFIADPRHQAWLDKVRSGRQPYLSAALALPGSPASALVAVPLHLPGVPVQLVVASLDLEKAIAPLLVHGIGAFMVRVRESDLLLYSSNSPLTDELFPVGQREARLEHGAHWSLSTYLTPGTTASQDLALLVLLGGLLLSCMLMFSQRMTWVAQHQARRLQAQQDYTEGQRRILGMISTLHPLPDILREICLLIERQAPQLLSSVYQVDCSGQRLKLRAAPSIGTAYSQAIENLPIGEGIGACGTAAFRREPVLVNDIAQDRSWKGYHHLAAAEGLRSCWSTPLLAGNGELLGTFAIYQRQPMQVDAGLKALVATVSQLAAVAIEHRNTLSELERSNRELQEFAFVASHDLQEPLRKIQTFAERLNSHSSDLDEQSRDYLQRMSSAAGRMQALILDLLAYSRVSRRNEPFVPVALDPMLDEVLLDLEGALESSGAEVQREKLPTIHGDPLQLRQLLQNLLSNAIKFHSPGEPPRIHIYAQQQGTGEWSLCVSDQGIGFDEKYLERIFQPFQRLHGRQAYPGTGIGLAIVKKIAERHGARLAASSMPGEGATFCITFRAATAGGRA